jgi:hypothetical protein
MAIGWLTDVPEGIALYYLSRLEQQAWDDVNDHIKEKALYNAYDRIRFDPHYSIPVAPTAAELERLKLAQVEMGYYLLVHLADEDSRKGIQAQGVIEAGIVKEKYSEAMLQTLPVPPFVAAILTPWLVNTSFIGTANLSRDEEESVKTKVSNF